MDQARRVRRALEQVGIGALVALVSMTSAAAAVAADEAARTALVIGNAGYAVSPLANASNDARDLGDVLEALGFETTVLIDQDKEQMTEAIFAFGDRLRERGGVGFFYYAGHGMEVGGENYLIPVGANIPGERYVRLRAVPIAEVTTGLANARNRMNIIVLDACRNNPFARSWRASNRGLALMRAPAETLIAYATAPGDVAADGVSARNSPYAKALIETMQEPGLSLTSVFRRTRARVKDQTGGEQVPWTSDNLTTEAYYLIPTGSEGVREEVRLASNRAPRIEVPPGMAQVPAGYFYSGCNEIVDSECWATEKPAKRRMVDAFAIDLTEVTVSAYRECVQAGRCTEPGRRRACNWGRSGRDQHPINCVDWHQAQRYCEWRGKRLPTQWEWEKAARGTEGLIYPWGDETATCAYAVIDEGSGNACGQGDTTFEVASKPKGASPYGVQDMAGNVWEWTSSRDARSRARVVRGGSWFGGARYARASNAFSYAADYRGHYVGFRCGR